MDRKSLTVGTVVLSGLLGFAAPAFAVNLVSNGDFELNAGAGEIGFNTSATGWSLGATPDYWFLFSPNSSVASGTNADNAGSIGSFGKVALDGPGNGWANGLTVSPDGGYFAASDPGFQNAPLQQTIKGLVVGETYTLSFDWAGAQQFNFPSPTTEGWKVKLGGETEETTVVSIPHGGFSGWMTATMTFTATDATEILSFLAIGGPGAAQPPFSLLDSVSLTPTVPEPSTWAMMLIGFGGMGVVAYRSRRKAKVAAAA